MRSLLSLAFLHLLLPVAGQYSHSIGAGITSTDFCLTMRYSYQHFTDAGSLLHGKGVYFTAGKGRYPEWNIYGVKDHWKASAGFMYGNEKWNDDKFIPVLTLGVSRHWFNTYPPIPISDHEVFNKWDIDFGSAAQIGRYYSWCITTIIKWELTIGFGFAFGK